MENGDLEQEPGANLMQAWLFKRFTFEAPGGGVMLFGSGSRSIFAEVLDDIRRLSRK